ncbi:MAG: hypothetical protein JSR86_21990, partial [Proteobacteria bacterium]|nr:hypothetical protein [Pseudomonadota bacterium]
MLALVHGAKAETPKPSQVIATSGASIFIREDGRLALRKADSRTVRVMSIRDLTVRNVACRSVGSELEIGADPQVDGIAILFVANWLYDCGRHRVRFTGQIDGRAASGVVGIHLADHPAAVPVKLCANGEPCGP